MKNWNFNGSLKENNKRVLTEAEGSVNMISARKDPSISFNNDNGKLKMTLNIPAGGGSGSGGGETESGVGRTYVTEDGESRGEYFNVYEGEHIGNAIGKFSHAEGGNLFRESSSCLPHTKWVGKTIWIDRTRPEFSNLSSCQIYIESSIASGLNSHAEGFQTAAIGDESHTEGQETNVYTKGGHAEGVYTKVSGCYAGHAEGIRCVVQDDRGRPGLWLQGNYGAHAEGYETTAGGTGAHAEGYKTKAINDAAHAEGKSTIAEGPGTHAEGNTITCYGIADHVEGTNNTLTNDPYYPNKYCGSHIEGGKNNINSAAYSHIEGYDHAGSYLENSHIEGEAHKDIYNCTNCHIEGKNNTTARLYDLHIEGANNHFKNCSGPAHIEGTNNFKENSFYSSYGRQLANTHIQGRYAEINSSMFDLVDKGDFKKEYENFQYADIIGGGTSDSDRKNISTLDWDGNQTIAGELYIKNSSQPLIRCLTQSEYNSLETKNPYTLYLIKEA